MRVANLPLSVYSDDSVTISTAQLFSIWNAIEVLSGDSTFSIRMVSETSTPKHKIAFLAASYASNFSEGIARISRFKRLCSPDKNCLTELDGAVAVTIDWPPGSPPEPPLSVDANFALLLELGRRGTGQHLAPLALELRRPLPKTDKHQAYFCCPIRYGAERDKMILNSEHLELPFTGHNEEFLDLLSPALASAVSQIEGEASLVERVKSQLKTTLSHGTPDLSGIARTLGMSERTLQRRITTEGKTFRALLTEVRHEMSRLFLADRAIELNEVAYLLGYDDTNSFSRAFRDWEGMTPTDWRRNNRKA